MEVGKEFCEGDLMAGVLGEKLFTLQRGGLPHYAKCTHRGAIDVVYR